MLLLKTIFLLLLSLNLYSDILIKDTYFINSNDIDSKTLIPSTSKNIILFQIPKTKSSIRIKSRELSKILKNNGFKDFVIGSRYIHFKKTSPINTAKISDFLNTHYLEKYDNINIKNIKVNPRSYLEELPATYSIHIRDKTYLSKNGIVSIKDQKNKKIFFNYTIDAELNVVKTKQKIKKGDEFSVLNSKLHKVNLDKFYAKPLQKIKNATYEAKHHIKKDKIISMRDTAPLSLVKKDSTVSVFIFSNGMNISFAAKALQNGKLNDIISIKKSNGKRLKAKVVGKQRVEIK